VLYGSAIGSGDRRYDVDDDGADDGAGGDDGKRTRLLRPKTRRYVVTKSPADLDRRKGRKKKNLSALRGNFPNVNW